MWMECVVSRCGIGGSGSGRWMGVVYAMYARAVGNRGRVNGGNGNGNVSLWRLTSGAGEIWEKA